MRAAALELYLPVLPLMPELSVRSSTPRWLSRRCLRLSSPGPGWTTSCAKAGPCFQGPLAHGKRPRKKPAWKSPALLLSDCLKTLAVKFEQMRRIFLGLRRRTGALESNAAGACPSVSGGHGHKFHQIKSNVFVAARSCGDAGCLVHASLRNRKYETR